MKILMIILLLITLNSKLIILVVLIQQNKIFGLIVKNLVKLDMIYLFLIMEINRIQMEKSVYM